MALINETDATLIYQPSFYHDDLFVKCDMLVKNEAWQFDLVEVKAKNTIRKPTKAAPLLDDLVADCSIQHYVLKKTLGAQFSWECFLAHINKEYVKQWSINPWLLICKERVTDELMSDEQIELVLKAMRESLLLPEKQFESRYPYPWTDYMTYFGEPQPKQSLWSISRLNAWKKLALYEAGKRSLEDFDQEDIEFLKNNKWGTTAASIFLDLWMSGEETLDKEAIQTQLQTLVYPLYFYDYETMSLPVPVFDGTSPRQQVVVQYSLHKITQDWTITHHEWVLDPIQHSDNWSLFATDTTTNESLLKQMINAMDGCTAWTYIVWYKWFENSRNTERSQQFPDYKKQLQFVNDHTFDLMELFSKQLYFHREFEWSSSIKNVLPVLTDISYKWMNVPNGSVAAQLLAKLITGELQWKEAQQTRQDLLDYCKLDSRAMVRIRQVVCEKVGL